MSRDGQEPALDIFEIGETVRRKRKELGYTQHRLAQLSGMSRTRINQIESGQAFDMKLGSIASILDAMGMSFRISDARDSRPVYEDIRKESESDAPGLG